MRDIDLRNAKAIFFDRGNVTHDCRSDPPQQERDRRSAEALGVHIERLTGRKVGVPLISELLILPWKGTFAQRANRGCEIPLETHVESLLASLAIEVSQRHIGEMVDVFGWAYVGPDRANPGIAPLMSALRVAGKRIGIVSNCVLPDRVYVRKYVEDGLDPYIGCYVFSYSAGCRKPDSRILESACHALGVSPRESVLVGDKLRADIACAKRCGALSIWYNPKGEANTSGIDPDYTVASFSEMEHRIAT